MKFKAKKICLFDFDGTIVDSMNAFADIAAQVIEDYYGTPRNVARKQYLDTSGIPFFQQLDILYPNNNLNLLASKRFEKEKLKGYLETPLLPTVVETTSWLNKNGILTAVSSNNFQNLVDEFVEKRGLRFDMVLGYRENFAKGKDHFLYIIKEKNLKKTDLIFVGDSIKDGERAQGFKIDFVGKIGIFRAEEFKKHFPNVPTIGELSELKEIIET